MRLQLGTIIDRYRIVRMLGRGGMGEVYLAEHVHLGSPCALKVLRASTSAQERRLLAEARAQSSVRHPNVVPVTDFIDTGDLRALVMDYVPGPNLQSLSEGPLDLPLVDHLASGLFDGLEAAHQRSLLHRDLKPANVMLEERDGRWHPRICDFGLVRYLEEASQTREGVVMGTPGYMAPEQCRARRDIDERADIFALGATLYDLLSGGPPFVGDSSFDILEATVSGRFIPLRERRPDAPERMERAIHAALSVHRADRPSTVADLRALWLDESRPPERAPAQRSSSEHPELDVLVCGGPEVEAHLAQCPRCRIALRMFRRSERADPVAAAHGQQEEAPDRDSAQSTIRPSSSGEPVVSRDALLTAIEAALTHSGHQVTVLGPAGVGKTWAVRELLAARPAHETHAWCPLVGVTTLDAVVQIISTTVGVRATDAASLAWEVGAAGPAVLVLDGAEQASTACAELVPLLVRAAPNLRIVITSRQRLGLPGEQSVQVGPLSPRDAAALFRARALSARAGRPLEASDEAVLEIVDELDHLPLAIELAAGRLSVISLEALASRMERRFRVLRGRRDPADRHATLRRALDDSWEILEPWERAALIQFSSFRGDFSLDAAEAVIDLDDFDEDALSALQALEAKSLLQVRRDDLYGLLNAVRDHARMQGTDRDAELRHAEFYAETYGSWGGSDSVSLLLAQLGNVRVAGEAALASGRTELAARAWRPLIQLALLHGPLSDGLTRVTTLLDAGPSDATQVRLLISKAEILDASSDFEAAGQAYERARSRARGLGDPYQEARVVSNYGVMLSRTGRTRAALQVLQEAHALWSAQGRDDNAAILFGNIGRVMSGLGMPEALAQLEEGRRLHERRGDHLQAVITETNIAIVYLQRGELEEALARIVAVAAFHEREGYRPRVALAGSLRGDILRQLGRTDEARDVLEDALHLAGTLGDAGLVALASLSLGELELQLGDARGRARLVQVIQDAHRLGLHLLHGRAASALGRYLAGQGALAEALRWHDEAVEVLEKTGELEYRGLARVERARSRLDAGEQAGAAEDLAAAALTVEEAGGSFVRLARALASVKRL